MIGFHGVNSSPGLASFYLRAFPLLKQWLHRAFVSFTVTGIARNFHPHSLTAFLQNRRTSLCRYTGYSFVDFHYKRFPWMRQLDFAYPFL